MLSVCELSNVTLMLEGGSHTFGHLRKLLIYPLDTPASIIAEEEHIQSIEPGPFPQRQIQEPFH